MTETPKSSGRLPLYITPQHPCSYFADRQARTLFLPEVVVKDPVLYQALIDQGFRRSGEMLYRPECNHCRDCIQARIPVARFRPKRRQRRVWKALHETLETRVLGADFNPEHYALYVRYLQSRHPGGEMTDTTEAQYIQFLSSSWSDTRFVEFRRGGQLFAVSVIDLLPEGMSAVYTFFEPGFAKHSPGVFAILWQIEQTRRQGLPWVYLGYWIPDCRKMEYKAEYRPIQLLHQDKWVEIAPESPLPTSTMTK